MVMGLDFKPDLWRNSHLVHQALARKCPPAATVATKTLFYFSDRISINIEPSQDMLKFWELLYQKKNCTFPNQKLIRCIFYYFVVH